jgi:hypothetical protein
LDLAYAFAATQVTAYMAHEQSLHGGVPRAAVAGAAVGLPRFDGQGRWLVRLLEQ